MIGSSILAAATTKQSQGKYFPEDKLFETFHLPGIIDYNDVTP